MPRPSTSAAVLRDLAPADRRIVLACLCLASLALRSENYPVFLHASSAEVRVQDALFALLFVLSVPLLLAWVRANRVIAAATAIFCLLVGVAALRSPVGDPAIVAVGKYLMFVLAGAAIAINIRHAENPRPFTWAFVGATLLNLVVAVVQSLSDTGIDGPLTIRTGGLLGLESAAALAIVTMIWCLVRLSQAGKAERRAAVAGIATALSLLLLAKSVLAVAALLALAVASMGIPARGAFRAATVGTVVVLVLIVTIGRHADLRSAIVGSTVPPIGLVSAVPGDPPQVPPRYAVRQPSRVSGGSFVHRVALGYVGARIALDSPLLGRGWQSTSSSSFLQEGPYDAYMVDRFPDLDPQLFVSSLPNGPHNAYIQLIAEAGWAAALALITALLATLVAGFIAIRRRATESWTTAVGAAWVAVVAVFLTSSSLFGGQFESSILGAAIVLGAPAAGLSIVRPRMWVAAATAVMLGAGTVAAGLFLPASDAEGQPVARVRALTEEGRGTDLFRRGAVPAGTRVVLDNGLLRAGLSSGALELVPHTVDAGGPTLLELEPPTRIALQVITHREADVISIEGRDAARRPVIKLAVRRGIPGAFVQLLGGHALRAAGRGAVLRGSNLGTSSYPVERALHTSSLRGNVKAALVTSRTDTAVAIVSDPARGGALAEGERFFIGILPRPRPVNGTAVPAGGYMVVQRGSRDRTQIVRETKASRRRGSLVVPYLLDDRDHTGLAELLGFNVAYGRRLGPLP